MSYKTDYHIHSFFSPDSQAKPEDSIKRAEELGLNEIIFTEHCDCSYEHALPPEEEKWPLLDVNGYTKYIEDVRKKFNIKVGIGIELGQAVQDPIFADKMIKAYPWDMVIGSYHNLKGEYDFCFMKYKDMDLPKLMKRYFQEQYLLVEDNRFDVLGHLYYFVRYIYRQGLSVELSPFKGIVSDIFKLLVKNGRGIEINTSCIGDKYNDLIPNFEFIKLYKQCGGEIITIGSDSHTPDRIGFGQELAVTAIKEAGFKAITTFEKRKPSFKDI